MKQTQENNTYPTVYVKQDNNNVATVGFIFAFLFPFIGFGLSIAACARANRKECAGKGLGLAIAGLIISAILCLAIITLCVLLTIVFIQYDFLPDLPN